MFVQNTMTIVHKAINNYFVELEGYVTNPQKLWLLYIHIHLNKSNHFYFDIILFLFFLLAITRVCKTPAFLINTTILGEIMYLKL